MCLRTPHSVPYPSSSSPGGVPWRGLQGNQSIHQPPKSPSKYHHPHTHHQIETSILFLHYGRSVGTAPSSFALMIAQYLATSSFHVGSQSITLRSQREPLAPCRRKRKATDCGGPACPFFDLGRVHSLLQQISMARLRPATRPRHRFSSPESSPG